MSNILITEKQLKKIKTQLINEEIGNKRYERDVKIRIGTNSEQRYKGMEIGDIRPYVSEMTLTYLIEQEQRSWGIKDITLYDIKGLPEIEAEIDYYPDGSDDYKTDNIRIPLDWENSLFTTEQKGEGVITVNDEMEISLYISENGEFSVEMFIEVYNL